MNELETLYQEIAMRLELIEKVVGKDYDLTLIATHNGAKGLKDADILLTRAKRPEILRAINRFLPDNAEVSHGVRHERN